MSVLGTFDEHHRTLGLTEISTRADLPPATALRIARQLVAAGALAREPDGRYVVGRRLWALGLLAPVQTDVREVAAPHLQDLQAVTRATVHLAERDGEQVVYLDRQSGRASVPVVSRTGSRLPLHPTGVGKVLLAHAPDEIREAALAKLTVVTPHTITSRPVLEAQLDRIRREGYATTEEEMSLGACSAAVPVTGPEGEVVAALGIVVSSLRRDRVRLVSALRMAAAGISRGLRATSAP